MVPSRLAVIAFPIRPDLSRLGSYFSALRDNGLTVTIPGGTYYIPWVVPAALAGMALIFLVFAVLRLSRMKTDH